MFTNIPYEPTEIIKSENRTQTVVLSSFDRGVIKLSAFAALQFIEGINLLLQNEKMLLSNSESRLLINLFKVYTLNQLEITREELVFLKIALELRMAHCEKERDERSEKFNADTYIGQKLLLLDIREILIGEVIEEVAERSYRQK